MVSSIFFFFYLSFSSPNLSRRRLDVCHTSTHGVALVRIDDAGLKRAARGSQGRSDGAVYRYIYLPKISPWKLFCALIAADVVRLLVYIGL